MITDACALAAAVVAILMLGSSHLRFNITMYALQTALIAAETFAYGLHRNEWHLCLVALAIFVLKASAVPVFLMRIVHKVNANRDEGSGLPLPLAMHLAIALLAAGYVLAHKLPVPPNDGLGWPGATASISLISTGLLFMMTRRIALSQVVGFLVMENGIYLFGLTQTKGMPMMIEMGIMLDVLVAVMVCGMLVFKIHKSFEHIDVTLLTDLKE